jgi:hypothetical protein
MNSLIWRNLPSDLVRTIVLLSNPTIDTRLYFNIPPRKLDEADAWKLWYRLKSHDGIIYNVTSQSLHILRIPGCHIIHRPVLMNAMDEWMSIFNQDEHLHTIETMTLCGVHVTSSKNSFYTEVRVLLKD